MRLSGFIAVLLVALTAGCGSGGSAAPPTTTTSGVPTITPTVVEQVARCLTAAGVQNRELSIPSMSKLPIILVPRGRQGTITFFRTPSAAGTFQKRLKSRSHRIGSAVYETTAVARVDRKVTGCLNNQLAS